MKTKYVLAIFFSSLAAGAGLIWLLSMGTQSPVELITPTQFAAQKEIGAAAFESLGERIRHRKMIVIGIPPQPETYQNIVIGFLEKLAETDPNIIVLKEPKWPALPTELKVETFDFMFSDDDLTVESETIQRALDSGKTLVIYSVNIFSSHLILKNPIRRFEEALNRKIPALTVGQLTLRQGGEYKNDPKCVGSMRDTQGLYDLGCAQLANSRHNYRNLLPLDKLTAILVEQSEDDYLLQVYIPD